MGLVGPGSAGSGSAGGLVPIGAVGAKRVATIEGIAAIRRSLRARSTCAGVHAVAPAGVVAPRRDAASRRDRGRRPRDSPPADTAAAALLRCVIGVPSDRVGRWQVSAEPPQ